MAGTWEKRGKNAYRLTVDAGKDFQGKRVRKTKTVRCTSDRQADKELAKFYTEVSESKFIYSGKVTVAEMCDKYLAEHAEIKVKKSTFQSYNRIVGNHITPLLGKHALDNVTALHIQEWVNYLAKEKKLSPKTVRNCLSVLSEIMSVSKKWGFIKENVCKHAELPPRNKKESDSFTAEEVSLLVEKLLALPDEKLPLKLSVFLALFTGARLGEIAGLEWENVDLEAGYINIVKTRMYVSGQGTYEETPKSKTSKRAISIPAFCVDLLKKTRVRQLEARLLLGPKWKDDKGYVFLSDFGAPSFPQLISERFTKFLKNEGMRPLNFHSLRHTHTSMLVDMNIDIVKVSKRLGHSQISTTQNIYAHIYADKEKEISGKLENMFATILTPKGVLTERKR